MDILFQAVECSELLMKKLTVQNRRTMDMLSAKCYFYYSRSYELTNRLDVIRTYVYNFLHFFFLFHILFFFITVVAIILCSFTTCCFILVLISMCVVSTGAVVVQCLALLPVGTVVMCSCSFLGGHLFWWSLPDSSSAQTSVSDVCLNIFKESSRKHLRLLNPP